MTQAGGNRSKNHELAKENLYVKILEEVEVSESIDREVFWYNLMISDTRNKLFNARKPNGTREFLYEFFREHLIADESSPTGLRWIKPVLFGRNANRGDVAGTLRTKDKFGENRLNYRFWVVCIKRKFYPAHVVAWVLQNKQDLPSGKVVMHLDNDPLNNKSENLKIGTQLENRKSKTRQARNTTGVEGVKLYLSTHNYSAQINDEDGKPIKVRFHFHSDNRKYKPKKTTFMYETRKDAFVAACKWRYEMCKMYRYYTGWYSDDLFDISDDSVQNPLTPR
jgi:hypothetical protein